MDVMVSKISEGLSDPAGEKKRGRLKIYLGFAPGVGKTYNMLSEAHQLKQAGIDIIIGYIEPHERIDIIEKVKEFEMVPSRIIDYRKIILKELDTDAVIKRCPQIALIDELAHTNAPGSKNKKRYQDVEEILGKGINVITTLNIQHFESLYNIVEESTGVKVNERIPDEVVANAELIVNVDIEAEELIDRLLAGKVYKPEMIDVALSNFFTVQNLTKLREIVLSETANMIDKRQREEKPNFLAPDTLSKIMVIMDSNTVNPDALLRKAYRMATSLNSKLYVGYASKDKKELPANLELTKTLKLVEAMDADAMMFFEKDLMAETIKFSKENGITHLIIGKPKSKKIKDLLQKSHLEKLMQNLPDADIIMG